jgi:tetratricopeptide (TPR) repeat protein
MNIENHNPTNAEIKELIDNYKSKKFNLAIKLATSLTQRYPSNQFCWKVLGALLGIKGKKREALNANRKAVNLSPKDFESQNNLGNALKALGKLEEAINSYKTSVLLKPDYAGAYYNLALCLQTIGKLEESKITYEKFIYLKSDYPEAYFNLGNVLQKLNEYEKAEINFKKALKLNPSYTEAYNNLGVVLRLLGRLEESEKNFEQVIKLNPNYFEAYNNLGLTQQELGKHEEAIISFRKAIYIKSDFEEAHYNLGIALDELGKFDESKESYKNAIKLNSNNADYHNNIGMVLQELGKLDGSEQSYNKAIKLNGDHADANFNLSMLLNLKGELKKGFNLYNWRYRKNKSFIKAPSKELVCNSIDEVKNKNFLVYEEQGIGDIIQFYRYLNLPQLNKSNVTFKVKSNLHRLLKNSNNNIKITDNFPKRSNIDFECPLLSLPNLFKTEINSIPNYVPYLKAESKNVERWAQKLKSDKFKIGICWQGSKKKIDRGRSFSLSLFKDISKLREVELISLYKGEEENQILNIDFNLRTLGNDFDKGNDAFIDTAAVMKNCDLIITSDTVIAHLAGALGCPVWVALKLIPDWRWMLNRKDSPWYPTMTLYRQKNLNDWNFVFKLIKEDLFKIL